MYKYSLKHKKSLKKGFSLVEMLVAVGVFMTIMTIAVSSLISIIAANRKAQAIKSTIDGVTFVMENISRDMRIGTLYYCSIDGTDFTQQACLDGDGNNIGGMAVRYISGVGKMTTYTFYGTTANILTNGVLIKTSCPTSAYCIPTVNNTVNLISQDSSVNIRNMKFYVIGANCELGGGSCTSRTQPRIVVTASGAISVKGSGDTTFNLQTSITQRARR